ncbi:hypothetical protein SynMEDNS5_00103 [Synechococcus sp. MEDNS5]|nr:hypothetical protein SynMEDNS5_00103 [Synechococcus sp. MEDNS5]
MLVGCAELISSGEQTATPRQTQRFSQLFHKPLRADRRPEEASVWRQGKSSFPLDGKSKNNFALYSMTQMLQLKPVLDSFLRIREQASRSESGFLTSLQVSWRDGVVDDEGLSCTRRPMRCQST